MDDCEAVELLEEIRSRFGEIPPFFNPAVEVPAVLENLVRQTVLGYLDNPIPQLIKEKICARVSRHFKSPYALFCHASNLSALGMDKGKLLELLSTPRPLTKDIEQELLLLGSDSVSGGWPKPDSAFEYALIFASEHAFLLPPYDHLIFSRVAKLLAPSQYEHWIALLSYLQMCALWTEAHPDLSFQDDKRYKDVFEEMVASEPDLDEFMRFYRKHVQKQEGWCKDEHRAQTNAPSSEARRSFSLMREREDVTMASESPAAEADEPAISDISTSSIEIDARIVKRLADKRVLVVEDNFLHRLVVLKQLSRLGIRGEAASGGREAVEAASGTVFDAILMDCLMPDMDGFEAARLIRQQEDVSGRHVPIIALTGGGVLAEREKCLAAGMDEYLPKPVSMNDLINALSALCLKESQNATS